MTLAAKSVLGVIGGSGVYGINGLSGGQWRTVDSPFGAPSDQLLLGELDGQPVAFLPRHGRGHRIPPGELNHRANIDALKRAGATRILSVSAVGSLREDIHPGAFVIVDQFIDRTMGRTGSFFGTGCVAHTPFARPVCPRLSDVAQAACQTLGLARRRGGTYVAIEGPQFSTLAESNLYRSWGGDVIGMTNMPEAKLAREAELCYATVAMVTDFDCWREGYDPVSAQTVLTVLGENAEKGCALVKAIAAMLKGQTGDCEHGCHRALEHAIVTAADARDPAMVKKLDAVAGRVLFS